MTVRDGGMDGPRVRIIIYGSSFLVGFVSKTSRINSGLACNVSKSPTLI
jgi:hypothetical protein